MPSRLAFCMVAISLQLIGLTEAASRESIHTVVTTECTPYFDWQVLGLWYRRSLPCRLATARCLRSSYAWTSNCLLGLIRQLRQATSQGVLVVQPFKGLRGSEAHVSRDSAVTAQ